MGQFSSVCVCVSLSLPGCLLCWDWLPVYDNEPQLHHHRLDFRHQHRQQWALDTAFHFTGFILSVVTFPPSLFWMIVNVSVAPHELRGRSSHPGVLSTLTNGPVDFHEKLITDLPKQIICTE